MAVIYDEILRIRNLREDKAKLLLADARARVSLAEQALTQARLLLESFIEEMPAKIDGEYAKLEELAENGDGVALHTVQSFRAYELDMYAQRDGLRLSMVERQKGLKEAQDSLTAALSGLHAAERARMKIEELQAHEEKLMRREQERAEERSLEEFKPRSIFAQLH